MVTLELYTNMETSWRKPAGSPTMEGLPRADPFFRRRMFVWVVELHFPGASIPCQTCGLKASSNG
ncbi:unnamed protein product [Ectocarpus sp. 13 AM-2016]